MPRILIIEDNRVLREITKAILQKAGFEVIEASDGETGLEMAISQKPDVVLVDVLLPGTMDGLDVCSGIRGNPATLATPIIVTSCLTQQTDVAAAKLFGADAYLTKPIEKDVLLERIQSLLVTS